jgi:hemerythrin-like metal-binding protein
MALLRWTKKYSVGVKALDEQHIEFIDGLNILHAAMLKGQAQSVVIPLFKKMMNQVNNHFSTEERLMENTKYSGLAEHRAAHQELADKVGEFVARYEQGDQTIYPPLLRFLGKWLHNHMLTMDKQYTQSLNNHGVH